MDEILRFVTLFERHALSNLYLKGELIYANDDLVATLPKRQFG